MSSTLWVERGECWRSRAVCAPRRFSGAPLSARTTFSCLSGRQLALGSAMFALCYRYIDIYLFFVLVRFVFWFNVCIGLYMNFVLCSAIICRLYFG